MKIRLAALGFLALLYLPALGSSSSGTHPDESYYLGISAEMDANGAWLTPTLDGHPKWFKPPLLYWAERAPAACTASARSSSRRCSSGAPSGG